MGKHGQKFAILTLAAFIVAACNLKHTAGSKPAGTIVIGLDTSDSTDVTKRCGEAVAQVHALLDDRHLRRLDILVVGTGDNATGGEPRVIVPWTTYAPTHDLYASSAKTEHQRLAWLSAIDGACCGAIRPSKASPVYEMVERSLASIAAHCGELERAGYACSRKVLSIASDLRSTYGTFGRYLKALAKRPKKPPPAPKPLDLTGVEAHACGLSNTDAGDGIPAAIVLQAWHEAFGTSVAIDPTCAVERDEKEATL